MDASQLAKLASQVLKCDPDNPLHTGGILVKMREVRDHLRAVSADDVLGCLDAAAVLASYLPKMPPTGKDDVLEIVSKLLVLTGRHLEAITSVQELETPQAALPAAKNAENASDMLIGDLLVARGALTPENLKRALDTQRATGMRIGESLVHLGLVGWEQIVAALREQRESREKREAEREAAQADGDGVDGTSKPFLSSSDGLRLVTDLMFGEIILKNGWITQDQLNQALRLQKASGALLGEVLMDMRAINRKQLDQALLQQAGRPKQGQRS